MCMGKAPWSKETSPSGKLLLTADEVAHRPSLSRATIYKMPASGELPVFRTGRCVRVPIKELEHWIEDAVKEAIQESQKVAAEKMQPMMGALGNLGL